MQVLLPWKFVPSVRHDLIMQRQLSGGTQPISVCKKPITFFALAFRAGFDSVRTSTFSFPPSRPIPHISYKGFHDNKQLLRIMWITPISLTSQHAYDCVQSMCRGQRFRSLQPLPWSAEALAGSVVALCSRPPREEGILPNAISPGMQLHDGKFVSCPPPHSPRNTQKQSKSDNQRRLTKCTKDGQ